MITGPCHVCMILCRILVLLYYVLDDGSFPGVGDDGNSRQHKAVVYQIYPLGLKLCYQRSDLIIFISCVNDDSSFPALYESLYYWHGPIVSISFRRIEFE